MSKKKKRQQPKATSPKQQRASMVQEAFRYSTRLVNQRKYENIQLRASLDFDPIRIKRRTAALLSTVEDLRTRVLTLYPELSEGFSVEGDWAQVNAQPRTAYDGEEDMSTVTLAIAIWILDWLKECGKLHEATKLLPVDDGQLDEIFMPPVWDPCHSEELLLGMMALIQNRNKDCVGKYRDPAVLESERIIDRFFIDLHTAENTHHQDVPSRNRFEAVLALIPTEAKEKATAAFTEKFWEWTDRYYQCRRIYALQEIQLDRDYKAFYEKAENGAKAITELRQKAAASAPNMFPLSFSMQPQISGMPSYNNLPAGMHSDMMKLAMQLEAGEQKLQQRNDEIEDHVSDLWFYLRYHSSRSYEESVVTLGKEITDIWADFSIDDPYELCFGFLYLLDNGSDLPWLYFPGTNLFSWIASYLPWTRYEYDDDYDQYWDGNIDEESDNGADTTIASLPKRVKIPDIENWYRMDYINRKEDPKFQQRHNIAQIVYEITGGIMPRKLDRYIPALEELDNYGISGKKAAHPLLYCMTLLGEGRRQSCDWRMETENLQLLSEDGNAAGETVSPEDLQAKVIHLQQEVDQLRRALHEAGRESREAKKKQEAADTKIALERQELADLRELVFHQQEGTYSDETPSKEIQFPCHTTQRIVVFGGHDSWAREIKPKLPDVRFVDRTVIPNSQLIRNADVVWIQTNALSHAYYYKIIDEVRRYNIPLRYFSYASATKCAEQILQQDME